MHVFGIWFDSVTEGVSHGHDLSLVALSFVIAALAAYCSLDMAERMCASSGRARKVWLGLSGLMLGCGIWSMHFIGMTALRFPFEAGYGVGLTVLSGVFAVGGCIAGLAIVAGRPTWRRLLAAGAVLGSATAVMHYAGMAALEFSGEVRYRPGPFGASLAVAMTASTAALWLSVSVRTGFQRLVAACAMAIAVFAMHYTAMAGAVLVAAPHVIGTTLVLSKGMLALLVAIGVAGLVIASTLLAFFDRRIQSQAVREAARLRALNAELEAARVEAERAVRVESQFLATMSHEIRTPMNGVLGMLEGVLRGPLSPDQRQQIFTARDSAVGLLRILNDVLDYSRLEAGQFTIESIPCSIEEIVDDTLSMVSGQAQAKGLVLQSAVADDVPDWISGDPLRIRQVLDNLAMNAVKFTDAGSVSIDVRCEGEGPDRRLHISVSDTGPGIETDVQSRLFRRFMQADASTTRRYGGAGLGLAICRELVTSMGGEIGVESRPGNGSVFHVRLPAIATPAPLAPAGAAAESGQSSIPLRILVAEDHVINQRVIRTLLESDGHDLTFAGNGRAAVEAVEAFRFDLVLMDVHMPEMDGVEATTLIRRLPAPVCDIPIIAVTANAMPGDRERYLASGMDDYVAKPVQVAELQAAIARVTGSAPRHMSQAPLCAPDPPPGALGEVLAALDATLTAAPDGSVHAA